MSANAQKTPFAREMNKFAEKKVLDAIQLQGKNLPASVVSIEPSGTIVTVKFEITSDFTLPQVTVPVAAFEYIRFPIQVGCTGEVIAADARLGGVTGLGGGTADLSLPANLTALSFLPLGSAKFSSTDDANAVVIYGPNGVILRDTGKNCTITLDQNNIKAVAKTQQQFKVGSATITITNGAIDIEGTLTINGKLYASHQHSGVTTGSGNSGPIVP